MFYKGTTIITKSFSKVQKKSKTVVLKWKYSRKERTNNRDIKDN